MKLADRALDAWATGNNRRCYGNSPLPSIPPRNAVYNTDRICPVLTVHMTSRKGPLWAMWQDLPVSG